MTAWLAEIVIHRIHSPVCLSVTRQRTCPPPALAVYLAKPENPQHLPNCGGLWECSTTFPQPLCCDRVSLGPVWQISTLSLSGWRVASTVSFPALFYERLFNSYGRFLFSFHFVYSFDPLNTQNPQFIGFKLLQWRQCVSAFFKRHDRITGFSKNILVVPLLTSSGRMHGRQQEARSHEFSTKKITQLARQYKQLIYLFFWVDQIRTIQFPEGTRNCVHHTTYLAEQRGIHPVYWFPEFRQPHCCIAFEPVWC